EEDSPLGEEEEEQLLLHVTEGPTDSWHHVKDLDSFFTKIYQFHQRNGFACVLLSDVLELVQFLFVVTFSTFLLCCVDYDVLFATRPLNHSHVPERAKVTLPDAVLPAPQCARRWAGDSGTPGGSVLRVTPGLPAVWVTRVSPKGHWWRVAMAPAAACMAVQRCQCHQRGFAGSGCHWCGCMGS
uniref:Autophagy-related protein 9 n=1 Tax=Serinus canaria TaxID=9135 RepID=A0A8C9N0Z8_SERCA